MNASDEDDVAGLTRLPLVALRALAACGRAEEACRIAARAWSLLRRCRPREAEALTAALHGLARRADPVPNHTGEESHG